MSTTRKYSPEFRERAVRLVFEHQGEYDSLRAAMNSIAGNAGCTTETLLTWARLAERERGYAPA